MLRRIARGVVYPLVVGGALCAAALLLAHGYRALTVLALVVPVSVVCIAALERLLPFRRDWNENHGDVTVDLMHTAVTALLLPRVYTPLLVWLVVPTLGHGLWPANWPLTAQVALALVLTELPWYALHRLCHETSVFGRLHSVHHSSTRLYWLNGSRDHPLAVVMFSIVLVPLFALGIPEDALTLYLVFNGVHGAFQHANVDARLGPLNWIVSMSELHRFHHSTKLEVANKNYGHNLIVWDVLFGTRYAPASEAPQELGIGDMPNFPAGYAGQLAAPFVWKRLRNDAISADETLRG